MDALPTRAAHLEPVLAAITLVIPVACLPLGVFHVLIALLADTGAHVEVYVTATFVNK